MKRIFSLPRLLILLVSLLSPVLGSAQEAAVSAKDLTARLSASIRDGSSLVRLKLESGTGSVLQLQVKSRRDASGTHVLYQILWPKDRKGEGFVIRQSGNRAPEGNSLVLPGTLSTITSGQMDQPVFGTDLCYADLVENFYAWSQQAITGQETVDRIACTIVESKPGGSDRSVYGMVRSWIDTKRMVPLRVEKFNKSGQLVRRITTTKVAKDDTRNNVAASFTVQRAGQTTLTNLEGSNSRHDVSYAEADFVPEALRTLGK
jgi:outer membrane lipoprotein-sorting protein